MSVHTCYPVVLRYPLLFPFLLSIRASHGLDLLKSVWWQSQPRGPKSTAPNPQERTCWWAAEVHKAHHRATPPCLKRDDAVDTLCGAAFLQPTWIDKAAAVLDTR